mgnify:CR=1 FL=1
MVVDKTYSYSKAAAKKSGVYKNYILLCGIGVLTTIIIFIIEFSFLYQQDNLISLIFALFLVMFFKGGAYFFLILVYFAIVTHSMTTSKHTGYAITDDNRIFKIYFSQFRGTISTDTYLSVLDNSLNDVVTINKPTNKIEEVFISSDLLLMTSRFEGAPLVIGEAKAFSLPVVTTRYKGNVNLFKNGYDGFIIETRKEKDIANKLKDILSDEKALLTYKRNAYDSALSFDKSSIKEAWINLLNSSVMHHNS